MATWLPRNSRRAWAGGTQHGAQLLCSDSRSTDHHEREGQLAERLLEEGVIPGLGEQLAAGGGQGLLRELEPLAAMDYTARTGGYRRCFFLRVAP